jgi:DNA-binding NtrC family response regulator
MRILLVEDDKISRITLKDFLLKGRHEVTVCEHGDEAVGLLGVEPFDVVLTDLRLPGASGLDILRAAKGASMRTTVIVMTAYGTVDTAVEALKMGAYDYLTKPFAPDRLLSMLDHIRQLHQVLDENAQLRRRLQSFESKVLIGDSPAMRKLMETVQLVAAHDYTVLVQGESGTGKELVARALHAHSPRSDRPFVTINCAALPASLLESELFGHEKGAFTGAVRRHDGYFERAAGGTVFIDEIDDFPLTLQPKLLRVLQEKEFVRVGGSNSIAVDVRIICATKVDLFAEVNAGRFRADLFYRLNIIPITIPPLRQRKEDLVALLTHFLEKHGALDKLYLIDSDLMARLHAYGWPGNVRELENFAERIVALAGTASHDDMVRDAFPAAPTQLPIPPAGEREQTPYAATMEAKERELIASALRSTGGNVAAAAKLLGLPRSTLRSKLGKKKTQSRDVRTQT